MITSQNRSRSAFVWNAGGWFGSQLGSTLWLLILGLVLFSRDSTAASVCVISFLLLTAWGLVLWQRRWRLSAYAGIQRLLLLASVLNTVVVVLVNIRGLAEPPAPGVWVSTYLPYWVVGVAPALMLIFFVKERRFRQVGIGSAEDSEP